jgi:hypothetical protein
MTLYVSGCKNKCGSIVCQNGASCISNLCSCPTGYWGNACQNSWSGEYIGTYDCVRGHCSPLVTNNDTAWVSAITVASSNGGYTVNISDFGGSTATVTATVDSVNNIRVTSAVDSAGVDATGVYSTATGKSVITMTYTTTNGAGVAGTTCKMVMTKR